MGADGKSAEIEVNPPLTIEPDTDNAGVGNCVYLRLTLFAVNRFLRLTSLFFPQVAV